MTDLLYQTDSYRRDFEARVTNVLGEEVVLDRSVFYPSGGGQPCDFGMLDHGGCSLQVTAVRKDGAGVWHRAPAHGLQAGDAIRGTIDWERRYQLMRTHTSLHILSAVIWRDYAAKVTGGNMDPLTGRLDFELGTVGDDFVQQVERSLNNEINAALPITIRIVPRDEAMQIPDLIRTKVNLLPPDIPLIRVVEIRGLDLQADGGTHVANTSEVGAVRVARYENKGKNFKRIRIEVQDAAARGSII